MPLLCLGYLRLILAKLRSKGAFFWAKFICRLLFMKFQDAVKFSLRFDIIVQNLSEGDMKNSIFLWLLLAACAFSAAKDDARVSASQQAESNLSQPNFEIFYDENASDAQIDAGLDALLEFAAQNPSRIDEDFGEFKDRIFTAFIFNPKVLRNSKFDFERIEKILKFKPNLNYGGDGGFFSPLKLAIFFGSKFSGEMAKLYHFDSADAMRLLELLVRNGADVKASGLLRDAAANDNFEAFKFLIANGARDTKDVVGSVAGSELIFLSDNNVSIFGYKEALPLAAREFAAGAKFKEFRDGRLRYVEEILKFQSFASIDKKEIETLIKVAVVLDDEMTAEFFLAHGLCKQKELCEFLKAQAKTYDAAKISKILSRQKG